MSTNKRYFDFRLITEENSERKVMEQEKAGCEVKRFRRTERNDILITDYTSIKKIKLVFTQPIHNEVKYQIFKKYRLWKMNCHFLTW